MVAWLAETVECKKKNRIVVGFFFCGPPGKGSLIVNAPPQKYVSLRVHIGLYLRGDFWPKSSMSFLIQKHLLIH